MLNEILGPAARFQQLLTRKFGVLGGAPSPQLTPEVTPEFSLPNGPENLLPAMEVLASGVLVTAAVAGNSPSVQLRNPTNSNLLVVVEHIEFTPLGGAQGVIGSVIKNGEQAVAAAAGGVIRRDTRTSESGNYTTRPSATLKGDINATMGQANLFQRNVGDGALGEYNFPVILGPGWTVQVWGQTVNRSLIVGMAWREVPMAMGEVGPF
jgi:hypothetical protein